VSKEALDISEIIRAGKVKKLERLLLLSDIINIEVGDTALTRAKSIEREFDIRQLYIKNEGNNPTGTQKDRIAFAQVYDAMRQGYKDIVLATCGNYGVAVALACSLAGVNCRIFIPSGYHTNRIKEMEDLGATIYRLDGTYEDVVSASSDQAKDNKWYDANPGGINSSLQMTTYGEIAYEIYDDLRDAPKYCAVPVSNGTLMAGIYRGFVALYKRGKTSRIPKMIGASATHKNPIISSYQKNLPNCQDLDPSKIKETEINEPLINWHSFDGEEALEALYKSNGLAFSITDKAMKDMSLFLSKKEGLNILPASTSGLIALLKAHKEMNLEPDRFVAILTAKN